MAKNTFLDWDTTASNNTDIGGIGILGTNAVSNFDDALRTAMAQLKAGLDGKLIYTIKSATYLAVANDNNGYMRFTAAATLNLTAAATLGSSWHLLVVADGGDVVIDPNGAELINGLATLTIKSGDSALIICTGTAFFARVPPSAMTYVVKSANYTALDSDYNASIRFSAAATLAFDVTANLRTNWRIEVWNDSTGLLILDPDSTNTINGALTLVLQPGQKAEIFKTSATTFQASVFGDPMSGVQAQGSIAGLTLSNNATDAVNDIDIAAGYAAADVSPFNAMSLSAILTKRLDANWAVGTNQGGLDTGSIANTTYHVWLIQRSDTGVVDALFSASATAPTMPTSYDRKRRIGSIIRKAASILAFTQTGNVFTLSVPSNDYSTPNPGTSAVLASLTTPAGIRARAQIWFFLQTSTATRRAVLVTSPEQADTAPSAGTASTLITGFSSATGATQGELMVRTNVSSQIRFRFDGSDANLSVFINTNGWIDDQR